MNTHPPTVERVLAIYCLIRGFGYVVFEGSNDLIDWAVVRVTTGPKECGERAAKIMQHYLVDLVITEDPEESPHRGRKAHAHMEAIRQAAKMNGTPWKGFSREEVRETFAGSGRVTKHKVATMIVARYPELTLRLPPRRKAWNDQDSRMAMFDAVTLASTYFASRRPKRTIKSKIRS